MNPGSIWIDEETGELCYVDFYGEIKCGDINDIPEGPIEEEPGFGEMDGSLWIDENELVLIDENNDRQAGDLSRIGEEF